MNMNLYLISQTINDDYDTFSDAVVVAKDEDTAKQIHPSGVWLKDKEFGTYALGSWASPENVTAILVGTAIEELKEGAVVCASFHAG